MLLPTATGWRFSCALHAAKTKLHLDCRRIVALCAQAMLNDRDLINQLLTRAGVAMEDAHLNAIVGDDASFASRISAVRQAGVIAVALANAAEMLWQANFEDGGAA